MAILGIDVSHHQGVIDWDAVKSSGVKFAIVRVSYSTRRDDTQFERNIAECERLGIPHGVYIYSLAESVEDAIAEAEKVISDLNGRKLEMPVFYDLESERTRNCSSDAIQAIATSFCKKIEESGYRTGIYANKNWFTNILKGEYFDKCLKWVAQYNDKLTYSAENIMMWQYSSDGAVNGIKGRVDMDWCYYEVDSPVNVPDASTVQVSAPAPQKANRIAVDGILGTESVKAMQRWLGTPVDGVVSGQLNSCAKYLMACPSGVWRYSKGGSMMVKALQNWLGVTSDGYMGRKTIMALQRRLGVTVDGYLGKNTAKALQTYLNNL
jgi:GH25 family lysozyme M1 (1,4-beta-N-acetylmuramidase)